MIKKYTQKEYKKTVYNILGELPTLITNGWFDDILKTDKCYMFMLWGFCYLDLSKNDLSGLDLKHLELITFNSSTIFPPIDKMPKGFEPKEILERGQNPFLGIRELHKKGIDGRGITVANIDGGFQSQNHVEFKGSNIEEVNLFPSVVASFHADGVLSNLCGQTLGVAPKVKVLHYNSVIGGKNFTNYRLLSLQDILKRVQNGEPIRVVNMSGPLGIFKDNSKISKQFNNLISELSKLKCEVVDSERFSENFSCCGFRLDKVDELTRANWITDKDMEWYSSKVSFVCGGKVTPEFTSDTGYKYENEDCYSWTIPQAVGMYALSLQQDPNLTWENFAQISQSTSKVLENGVRIAEPQKIIEFVKTKNQTITLS